MLSVEWLLDGNGRIGRLLIGALMAQWGLLPEALMVLSGALKRHQNMGDHLLSGLRSQGAGFACAAALAIAVQRLASPASTFFTFAPRRLTQVHDLWGNIYAGMNSAGSRTSLERREVQAKRPGVSTGSTLT